MLGFVVKISSSGTVSHFDHSDVLWYNAALPEEHFTISLWKFG